MSRKSDSRKPQERNRDKDRERDRNRSQNDQQTNQQLHQMNLIDNSEIPKLSFTSIQTQYNHEHSNGLSPPLQKRGGDLDRVDKGYPQSGGGASKFGGSGKFPSLMKNTEFSSGDYHDNLPKLPRERESRRVGKLPPRELQPLTHPRSEKLRDPFDQQVALSGNTSLQRNQGIGTGRGSLQPLNAMLKSSSLSKIDREPPPQRHILETNLPSHNQKKGLAPLHHSGRQQLPTTRPW
jgi:hypothetical protein